TITLASNGAVSDAGGALKASTLTLKNAGTNGSGAFTLTNAANVVGTVQTGNQVASIVFESAGNFTEAGLDATGGSITLLTNGTVTGTGAVKAATLSLNNAGT